MAARSDRGAGSRPPLTRERVLREAVELADEAGIDELTMRRLAERLGVKAMSLYNHVADKDEILDGMVDVVFAEMDPPPGGVDWRSAMRERAHAARDAFTRHPWATALMQTRRELGPATLRHHDAVIGCLREAGFSIALTANAYTALDSYIYGYAVQEASSPHASSEEVAALAGDVLRDLPADEYPYLAEMIDGYVGEAGRGPVGEDRDLAGRRTDEFTFGLELILDGLDRARERDAI